jgi:hypothetical protein
MTVQMFCMAEPDDHRRPLSSHRRCGMGRCRRGGIIKHDLTLDIDLASGRATAADGDRATAGIVNAYTASAVFWLLVGSAYGTLAACKLV